MYSTIGKNAHIANMNMNDTIPPLEIALQIKYVIVPTPVEHSAYFAWSMKYSLIFPLLK